MPIMYGVGEREMGERGETRERERERERERWEREGRERERWERDGRERVRERDCIMYCVCGYSVGIMAVLHTM